MIWLLPFVVGAVQLFWEWLKLPDGAESTFADFNPLILLFPILGGAFAFWMLGGLKSVYLKDDCLLVSNYLKEIEIPLSNVENVSKPENSSHQRIMLYLREPSEFGGRIVFMPPLFRVHEVADELRDLAKVSLRQGDYPTGRALAAHIKRYRKVLKGKREK